MLQPPSAIPQSNSTKNAEVSSTPILSFFTGAGFLDLGFRNAGFRTIWRNEFDRWFVRGYEHATERMGLSGTECLINNTDSIVNVGPSQILREAFSKSGRPSTFGIIGGPPCPDFSVGGKNLGSEGERGRLSEVYVNRIKELKPTFFVFENVPGLLRTAKHRSFLMDLLRTVSKEYLLDIKILNALEFGAPQDRQRVFIVGFNKQWLKRNASLDRSIFDNEWLLQSPLIDSTSVRRLPGFSADHWFPWPIDERFFGAKRRFNWPRTNEFGGDAVKPLGTPEDLMVYKHIGDTDGIAALPNGWDGFEPKSAKFQLIREGDSSRKSFKRLHRFRYSPAAAYGNNEVHLHPTLPRRITVREAMRLQTVPDEYALPPEMPLSYKFKTVGNGVPIILAQAVGASIKRVLEGSLR